MNFNFDEFLNLKVTFPIRFSFDAGKFYLYSIECDLSNSFLTTVLSLRSNERLEDAIGFQFHFKFDAGKFDLCSIC